MARHWEWICSSDNSSACSSFQFWLPALGFPFSFPCSWWLVINEMGLCKWHDFLAGSFAALAAAAVHGKDFFLWIQAQWWCCSNGSDWLGFLADFPTMCQVMFTALRSETFCCCKLLAAINNRRYFLPPRIPKTSLKFTSGNRRVLLEHWIYILVLNQLFFSILSTLRSDAATFTPRVNTHFLN